MGTLSLTQSSPLCSSAGMLGYNPAKVANIFEQTQIMLHHYCPAGKRQLPSEHCSLCYLVWKSQCAFSVKCWDVEGYYVAFGLTVLLVVSADMWRHLQTIHSTILILNRTLKINDTARYRALLEQFLQQVISISKMVRNLKNSYFKNNQKSLSEPTVQWTVSWFIVTVPPNLVPHS